MSGVEGSAVSARRIQSAANASVLWNQGLRACSEGFGDHWLCARRDGGLLPSAVKKWNFEMENIPQELGVQ